MAGEHGDITELLRRWHDGDAAAFSALMPLVFDELHALAEQRLRGERADHTLRPTELVNEAYLNLLGQHACDWRSRQQFMAIAGKAMRRILVDHARRRNAIKRPPPAQRLELAEDPEGAAPDVDVLALDVALAQLERLDARQAQIVELKFFGGFGLEEIADKLAVSRATVAREWRLARGFLFRAMQGPGSDAGADGKQRR
jgi:RNA polymerase sigma factor (TIGR02999 family)